MADVKKILSWVWPQKVQIRTGEISPVLEIAFENGKKVLNAGQVNYSFGALHEVFQLAFSKTKIAELKPETVLILGFGAGSIARILTDELKISPEITAIEADAEVIRIARREFDADLIPKLQIIHSKAEDFVLKCESKFELIAVDVFVEQYVPESCMTIEFLQRLHELLLPGGVLVFNRMPEIADSQKDEFRERFKSVFPQMKEISMRLGDGENKVFTARK